MHHLGRYKRLVRFEFKLTPVHRETDRFIDSIINPESYNIIDNDNQVSILSELSGENTYVVTEQKLKNYFEYLELIYSVKLIN